MKTKLCNKCGIEKNINDFYKRGKYYCAHCKECMKENNKKWHKENKEKAIERRRKWREKHPNYSKMHSKEWKNNHKEQVREYKRNDYHKNKVNELYKIKIQTRHLIFKSFERKGYKKGSKTEQILGCNYKQFMEHLLQTYKNNYGIEWDKKELVHIDHIIPISTAKSEEEVIKLNHYTNLQLLKAEDNLRKSNKLNWELGD